MKIFLACSTLIVAISGAKSSDYHNSSLRGVRHLRDEVTTKAEEVESQNEEEVKVDASKCACSGQGNFCLVSETYANGRKPFKDEYLLHFEGEPISPKFYRCKCEDGFEGNGWDCRDIDECKNNPCPPAPGGVCVDKDGSYTCDCNEGYYKLDFNEHGPTKCERFHEPSASIQPSAQPSLSFLPSSTNVPSSTPSETPEGIMVDSANCPCPAKDRSYCILFEEDASGRHLLPPNFQDGTTNYYTCECKEGWEGSGFECDDIDECIRYRPCPTGAACVNNFGSYTCSCGAGFLDSYHDEHGPTKCTPDMPSQDENVENNSNVSDENGESTLGENGESTSGENGESTPDENGESTPDVSDENDETIYLEEDRVEEEVVEVICIHASGSIGCKENQECLPDGKCGCVEGYISFSGTGGKCEPDETCNDECGDDAECVEGDDGPYYCECAVGFTGDGKTCEDIDECEEDPDICGDGSYCINSVGSYHCAADCNTNSGCDENARCVNDGNGGQTCLCLEGFTGDGLTCKDLDECKRFGEDLCGAGYLCTNTIGSYECEETQQPTVAPPPSEPPTSSPTVQPKVKKPKVNTPPVAPPVSTYICGTTECPSSCNDECVNAADKDELSEYLRAYCNAETDSVPAECIGVCDVTDFADLMKDGDCKPGDMSAWDVSSVTTFKALFSGNTQVESDISAWDTSSVTSFLSLFKRCSADIVTTNDFSDWDTSSVTDMARVFQETAFEDGGIGDWDTSAVIDTKAMFLDAESFNGDIGAWNMASNPSMRQMFSNARAFNQDISGWNINAAAVADNLYGLFMDARQFNQPLDSWANYINDNEPDSMDFFLNTAKAFNQDLSSWALNYLSNGQKNNFCDKTNAWTDSTLYPGGLRGNTYNCS